MRGTVRLHYNHTGAIREEVKESASRVVRKTALDVLARAAGLVPVDTGNLKGSLAPGGRGNVFEMGPGDLTAVVGTNVEYAPYVEYGTRRMAAQPYLTPAAEAMRPAFNKAMSQLVKGA